MKLEDQVVDLELSKRLKELGIKKESLFSWAEYPHLMQIQEDGTSKCIETITEIRGNPYWRKYEINTWSAFTASEILEFYPKFINDWIFRIEKYPSEFEIKYCDRNDEKRLCVEFDKNLSNALAKMLIHLIENKIIEV